MLRGGLQAYVKMLPLTGAEGPLSLCDPMPAMSKDVVVDAIDAGHSPRATATRFGIAPSAVKSD